MKKKPKRNGVRRSPRVVIRSEVPTTPIAVTPRVDTRTFQGSVCKCGLKGKYTGCYHLAGMWIGVAFSCVCGEVWGFKIPREQLEKYRG